MLSGSVAIVQHPSAVLVQILCWHDFDKVLKEARAVRDDSLGVFQGTAAFLRPRSDLVCGVVEAEVVHVVRRVEGFACKG